MLEGRIRSCGIFQNIKSGVCVESVRSEGDNRIQRDNCRVEKQISTEGRERNADAGTKQSRVDTAGEGSVHFSERTIVVESSGKSADWTRIAEMSMDSGNGLNVRNQIEFDLETSRTSGAESSTQTSSDLEYKFQ